MSIIFCSFQLLVFIINASNEVVIISVRFVAVLWSSVDVNKSTR